jgi:uncharacterized protein
MSSLRELQQAFAHAVFAGPGDTATFVAGGQALADERIAIYRNTIFSNYRKALSATFPVVKRLAGAPRFNDAVDAFVRAHPSVCGDLNVYGDDFGEFLSGYAPAADLPYLADVARLEWAIDEAQRAPDAEHAPKAVLEAFFVVAPERLPAVRLQLEPSCRFVTSPHPILLIWNAHRSDPAGEAHVAPGEGADALLIRRDAHGVSLERLAAGEHAWLAALQSGATLGAAIDAAERAEAAFDLGAVLRTHIAVGTIMRVVDP